MPEAAKLAKAVLQQLDSEFKDPIKPDTWCTVQFNPETLKVSFANQVQQPSGQGDQRGKAAAQFVGAGTTKLALSLWFDVGSPQPDGAPRVDDVRKLTSKVAYFITPKEVAGKKGKFTPPAARFLWGSFQFDGIMESLEETLELFSPSGKPLRASLNVSLSQQEIREFAFADTGPDAGPTGPAPGTRPLAQPPEDATVQGVADAAGQGDDWPSIAAANGIENPRLLGAGAVLDLEARAPSVGLELGAGAGVEPPLLFVGAPAPVLLGREL
jgi:Contractile injection system tube protein